MRPKALDLFCKAGGVSVGLERAGFDVVGVDIEPQPRYRGGRFIQADAMAFPLDGFDFIWASPPCQAHTCLRAVTRKNYASMISSVRERLSVIKRPWAIENVPGAPLADPVILCGLALGLKVKRHRLIECSFPAAGTICPPGHPGDWYHVSGHASGVRSRRTKKTPRREPPNIAAAREAMDIDWMNRDELAQAIPPAYAEYIGRQVMVTLA